MSEKLYDALLAGCVPVYWGAPRAALANLTDFDLDGFLFVDGDADGNGDGGAAVVGRIRALHERGALSDAAYDAKRSAILHNFAVADSEVYALDRAVADARRDHRVRRGHVV